MSNYVCENKNQVQSIRKKDFHGLCSIQGRTVKVIFASSLFPTVVFSYEKFDWEFQEDKSIKFFDGFHRNNIFSIPYSDIKSISYSINEEREKMIGIVTNNNTITIWSKLHEDELPYKEVLFSEEEFKLMDELDKTNENEISLKEFENVLWDWQLDFKNILVQVIEPIVSTHVFAEFQCGIFDSDIFCDGNQSVSCAFNIDKKRIHKILKEEIFNKIHYILYLSNGIKIDMNEIKSNPKIWTRAKMNKAFDGEGVYKYV